MDQTSARFDADAHVARMNDQGFTIIEDLLGPATLAAAREALAPYLDTHQGRNPFEGFRTERVYTLVARGKVFEDLTEDPRVLAILDRVLQPNYLLSASQAIRINPGEAAQPIHTDDGFYRQPRPRPAISYSLIAAIDAFTFENGCTEVIPGSHRWGDARGVEDRGGQAALEAQLVPMDIPAGAAVLFPGTLLHRGGANRSDRPRLAFTNQYCEPWARTQENYYLGVPREQARDMSPRLQSLLGYSVWPPFMGQVTGSHPIKALADDFVPPVVAQRLQPI